MKKVAGRIALFGGALFTAGLAAAEPQFSFIDGEGYESYAYAYDYTTGTVAYAYGHIETLSFDVGDASIITSIEPSRLLIDADSNGAGDFTRAQGVIFVHGFVTEDTTVDVAWNFSQDIFGYVEILRITGGTAQVFSETGLGPNPVGTDAVSLLAGVEYLFRLGAGSGGPSAEPRGSFASIAIPAPASAVLLGLAGLAAPRRRRGVC
jgi:hypothetical protein